jgi:Rod binding domain-containing protein
MDDELSSLSRAMPVGNQMGRVDRSKVDPQLVKAAEGMEAMFIDYLLKVMRQTVPKNEMDLESSATDLYRGMMDHEWAEQVAHSATGSHGIGLADEIIAYLSPPVVAKEVPSIEQSVNRFYGSKKEKL